MKSAIRYIIAIVLSGGALYLAFRGQDIGQLQDELSRTNLFVLGIGTALQVFAHFVRAWRWKYLLKPFKKHTNLYIAFKSVMAGYALNNVIPRSGEVARPLIVAKREQIPFTGTLGTIVLERVFDIIIVGVLLFISYLMYADVLVKSFPELINTTTPIIIIFILGLGLFAAAVLNPKVHQLIERAILKVFPKKIAATLNRLFTTFTDGLRGLNRNTVVPLIAGTALVWFLYWLSMYVFLLALPDDGLRDVGIEGTTLLLTLSAVAVAIPTPGGLGTYHYFISQTLILVFGLVAPRAIAFATLSHFAPYVVVTIIGIFYAFNEGVSLKMKAAKKEEPQL
jgi:glycosyltransferase 2 family protein